jgi:basic membrane protein A
VFQVAGGCGLGAISAAADSNAWGIGVDNDQSFLGPQVLTSAQKKVDAGVTQTIKLVQQGKFKGGVDGLFNVKNGGVGYGKVSAKAPGRAALIAKLNTWAKQISTGKVKPPRTGIANG